MFALCLLRARRLRQPGTRSRGHRENLLSTSRQNFRQRDGLSHPAAEKRFELSALIYGLRARPSFSAPRDSSRRQFAGVRHIVGPQRAHLGALQRQHRHGVPVVADKLHFESPAIPVREYRRAHVTAFQAMGGQITGEGNRVEFLDRVHDFGRGWAVINRGALPERSVNQAVRTFKLVPRGVGIGPSIT